MLDRNATHCTLGKKHPQGLSDEQIQEILLEEGILEERNQEIRAIVDSITDIHEMFRDLNQLVVEQVRLHWVFYQYFFLWFVCVVFLGATTCDPHYCAPSWHRVPCSTVLNAMWSQQQNP